MDWSLGLHNDASINFPLIVMVSSYTRGIQRFSTGGHIDDFLRLGRAKRKKGSIYLEYGE